MIEVYIHETQARGHRRDTLRDAVDRQTQAKYGGLTDAGATKHKHPSYLKMRPGDVPVAESLANFR